MVSFFIRSILSLRYRFEVKGLEKLKTLEGKKSILFLPNHTSRIDPFLLYFWLFPKFRIRPVVVEYIYRLPLLGPFLRLLKACSIPNFDTSINQIKIQKAKKDLEHIASSLKKGDHFLLYASGRMKVSGKEVIGGASGAYDLLQECPEAHAVLIRVTGLWGSSFSRAITGHSPPLGKSLTHGFKAVFKNLIFFTPRRKIIIEIEPDPQDLPRCASRVEFNRYLENWYNCYPGEFTDSEPLQLVSYSCWKRTVPEISPLVERQKKKNEIQLPPKAIEKIYGEIRRIIKKPHHEITPAMSLSLDLGMDSLDIAELSVFLSHHFENGDIEPGNLSAVQDVLEFAQETEKSKPSSQKKGKFRWSDQLGRPDSAFPAGRTLPEAFLITCRRMKNFEAYGDDFVGVISYKKLLQTVLALASHFRTLPGKSVGILLPSSATGYILCFALLFARKIPVMMNWTLGSRYLDQMMDLAKIDTVITSWHFIERLSHVEFGGLIDKMQYLEDIKKELSWKTKIKGAFLSFLGKNSILRFFNLTTLDENSPAVILFTSGTEAAPKGVPLSHRNLLENLRSVTTAIKFKKEEIIYNTLPPFHSLGFSVVGIYPTLVGLKVAFHPDPTDVLALLEGIERWRATIFCSPATFIKGLFAEAKKEQLASVRLFVTGAEKTPPELFRVAEMFATKLVEAYGITECSPCISVGLVDRPQKGCGQLLPGIRVCTIHPETEGRLPPGSEGELCIHGPNVFGGYLGNAPDPFIELQGKRWYRTGDLGYVDQENNIILSGRLKRFIKIAGEMISLRAIEEAVIKELSCQNRVPSSQLAVTVMSEESDSSKPRLILFSIVPLEKEEVVEILKKGGFSALIKISAVQIIPEIPLMGSGKIDFRRLRMSL